MTDTKHKVMIINNSSSITPQLIEALKNNNIEIVEAKNPEEVFVIKKFDNLELPELISNPTSSINKNGRHFPDGKYYHKYKKFK